MPILRSADRALTAGISDLQGRGRGVIAAAPDEQLLVTKLIGGFCLVQPRKGAVVAPFRRQRFSNGSHVWSI